MQVVATAATVTRGRIEPGHSRGTAAVAANAGPAILVAPPQRVCSRSYVGSVFGRTGRFDQFSTFSPLKRAKSLLFVVASTSPCT